MTTEQRDQTGAPVRPDAAQGGPADRTFGFIGLGLIGGSIARGLKRADPSVRILAYMRTRSRLEKAKQDGIVDEILDGVNERLRQCDIIFLCTPVEYNAGYLRQIRPFLKPGAVVTDVGSTKTNIHESVAQLDMEDCFVGGHPMAGSEKTGYEHSSDHLLENAYYIITPTGKTPESHTRRLFGVAQAIGAIPFVMDYQEHDRSVAAISHLPHLIASSLVNLVHDSDGREQTMKRLAAGGFKDLTRIASSSPVMWEQICMTNAENIIPMLHGYIESLQSLEQSLRERDSAAVSRLFESSRAYRDSFAETAKGSITPEYSFTADVVDEPGALAIISAILAGKGISIKNIGINHNRENGEGALLISFYDKPSMDAAWERLRSYNYTLFAG